MAASKLMIGPAAQLTLTHRCISPTKRAVESSSPENTLKDSEEKSIIVKK